MQDYKSTPQFSYPTDHYLFVEHLKKKYTPAAFEDLCKRKYLEYVFNESRLRPDQVLFRFKAFQLEQLPAGHFIEEQKAAFSDIMMMDIIPYFQQADEAEIPLSNKPDNVRNVALLSMIKDLCDYWKVDMMLVKDQFRGQIRELR